MKHGLTNEELQEQVGETLPDRGVLSLVNANIAAPINAALALNVLSAQRQLRRVRERRPVRAGGPGHLTGPKGGRGPPRPPASSYPDFVAVSH